MIEGANLNIRQTAKRLGIGVSTTYNLIGSGKLQAFKIGDRTVITEDALKSFLENLPKADIRTGRARASV